MYQPLTLQQYQKAVQAGFTPDKIIANEKIRKAQESNPFNPKNTNGQFVQPGSAELGTTTASQFMGSLGQGVKQTAQSLTQPVAGGVKNVGNIAKGVGQSFKTATQDSGQALNNAMAGRQGAFGAGFQAVGNFSRAALSPITETVGQATGDISNKLSNVKGFQNFANSKIGNALSKANIPGDAYQNWANQHPEAAKNLEALGNITALGTSIPAGGEAGAMAQSGLKKVGTLERGMPTFKPLLQDMREVGTSLADRTVGKTAVARDMAKIGQKASADTLGTVRPKLTAMEEATAKAQGRGTTTGKIFKKTEIQPSSREVEMSQYAKDAGVKSKNTFDKNIQLMKDAQKTSADTVRQGLKNSKATWNPNELKGVLNKVEKPISLTQPEMPIADRLKAGVMKLVEKANKKPEGILDVRQGFDNLVEKNFGKNIFAKDDPKGILIRQYRQALNDFAESKLPEGKLANGQSLKGELRRQSLLYDAIQNVAEKAPKAGETARPGLQKVKGILKKPIIKYGLGALGAERLAKSAGLPLP